MSSVPEVSARFSVHFDGPITNEHLVSLRVMSKTYEHMQRAIDRAHLIEKYGGVYKHARLKAEDYPETEFFALYPREGGIILDAIRRVGGGRIIDRIADAINAPFDRAIRGGLDESAAIRDQLDARRQSLSNRSPSEIGTFQELIEAPDAQWEEAYSRRSVLKEVDQLVNQINSNGAEGSSVEVRLDGDRARSRFDFTPQVAARFHLIVSARELGPVVLVNAKIRDLDRGNHFSRPKAKILNIDSGREATLHLTDDADFQALHPFHTRDHVLIFASPYIEAGGFDVHGGDFIFVATAE